MKEFYPGNRFYGHGNIIRKYSGFPRWLPLPVCIQHGWIIEPIQHDARVDAVENWYWSANIAEKYKKRFPDIKYRIVGSPFLYCLKNIEYREVKESQRYGSIVFPFHSTEKVELRYDINKYCNMLHNLPSYYKPIIICIHYIDKKKGIDSIFSQKGFSVICNGDNPYNDNFLYNFIVNAKDKRYLISNEWSSAIHYGALLGCNVYIYGPEVSLVSSIDENFNNQFKEKLRCFDEINRNYYNFTKNTREIQRKISTEELGEIYMLSKRKMNFLLWRSIVSLQYIKKYLSI